AAEADLAALVFARKEPSDPAEERALGDTRLAGPVDGHRRPRPLQPNRDRALPTELEEVRARLTDRVRPVVREGLVEREDPALGEVDEVALEAEHLEVLAGGRREDCDRGAGPAQHRVLVAERAVVFSLAGGARNAVLRHRAARGTEAALPP